MRRLLPVLLLLLTCGCPVRTAIVDANERHSKMVAAQQRCWDLPRERVFETAKAAVADYRQYQIDEADPAKGRITTLPREESVPPGVPARRHTLVVQLETEGSCTRVTVKAPVEIEYSRKKGFEEPEKYEDAYGIMYDASLKIDAALRAVAPQPAAR